MIADQAKLDIDNATFVIVGHGTPRNPDSCKSTLSLTRQLDELHPELKFKSAFLDQEPFVSQIAAQIQTPNTIVIPFLISRGPHTIDDIPQAFGLSANHDTEFPMIKRTDSGITLCDLPVGMYPGMAELCLELIADQLLSGKPVEFEPPFNP